MLPLVVAVVVVVGSGGSTSSSSSCIDCFSKTKLYGIIFVISSLFSLLMLCVG